jgi:hypothetical protein
VNGSVPLSGSGDALAGVPVNGSVPLSGSGDALTGLVGDTTGVNASGLKVSGLKVSWVGVPSVAVVPVVVVPVVVAVVVVVVVVVVRVVLPERVTLIIGTPAALPEPGVNVAPRGTRRNVEVETIGPTDDELANGLVMPAGRVALATIGPTDEFGGVVLPDEVTGNGPIAMIGGLATGNLAAPLEALPALA